MKMTEKFWAVSHYTPAPGSREEQAGLPRLDRHPNRISYQEALDDLGVAADHDEDWQSGQIHKAFVRA